MNGVHDLGGMQDMSPIEPEKNSPCFMNLGKVEPMPLRVPCTHGANGIWMLPGSSASRSLR